MSGPLDDLLKRLREDRALFLSGEEATRQGAVLPILGRLGWDRDNVREVVPEYAVGNGRVDYCLRIGDLSWVFIEVKRTNEELERHQEQLLEYAFRQGVKIAVLTNGLVWWFYLPLLQGSWDQRKFFAIDIQQQDIKEAADNFGKFLGRDAVAKGSAIQSAEEMHASREKDRRIRETIPRAWSELCARPDELLLEILAEKVESMCGHKPNQEDLAEFLKREPSPREPVPQQAEEPPAPAQSHTGDQESWTFKRVIAYSFKGQRHQVSVFKDVLLCLCSEIFRVHRADFPQVFKLRGRRKAYFSRDSAGMTEPREIPGTGVYVETCFSADNVRDLCYDVLKLFGYSRDTLRVELRDRGE